MTHSLKYYSILIVVNCLGAALCAASPPHLNKAQVIALATAFAHEQKWDVVGGVSDDNVTFRKKTGEWQVFIQTKQNGGPMIVHVNDETRKIRWGPGE